MIKRIEVNGKIYEQETDNAGRIYPIKADGTRGREIILGGAHWCKIHRAGKEA